MLRRPVETAPFNNVISASQRDPDLPAKIRSETSGIFNRLLAGLTSYRKTGLNIPQEVASEAAKYVASSDLIQSFLDDQCTIEEGVKISARQLYQAYQFWSGCIGTRSMSQPIFKHEIIKHTGSQQQRTNKGLEWPGICLRKPRI